MVRDVTIDTTIPASLEHWWESVANPYVASTGPGKHNDSIAAYAPDGGIIDSGYTPGWGGRTAAEKRQYELEYYWLANFDVTWKNHLFLKEGDVFDGNGHTILVNHDICYNEVTGKYDAISRVAGGVQTHGGNECQHGLFRLQEFHMGGDSNQEDTTIGAWSKNPITIKNLKYGGTAPVNRNGGFYWNSKMGSFFGLYTKGQQREIGG